MAWWLVIVPGCGVDFAYLIPAGIGQGDIILRSVPVETAIASGALSDEQIAKLELIQDVRRFARDVVGLNVEGTYETFFDAGGEPVAYNLSAARKDALEPFIWQFPFVGGFPYLGFFDGDAADARAAELQEQGYDTYIYELDAYNITGAFPNPILSPMLERSDPDLVDTVIHELLHNTVWNGDVSFNESLATFVAREGTMQYYAERLPDSPETVERIVEAYADLDRLTAFALELVDDLEAFYSSDLSGNEKISGRDSVFQAARDRFAQEIQPQMNDPEAFDWVREIPTNNAYVLGIQRYNLDLDVFEQVHLGTERNWPQTLEIFAAAAATNDAYVTLRHWLQTGELPQSRHAGDAQSWICRCDTTKIVID